MSYYSQIFHSDVLASNTGKKPTKFKIQTGYPFGDLDPRDFERLVYLLYYNEIRDGANTDFDRVQLMQGVGDRGRDCTLYLESECVGIIQCKCLSANLDRPTLGREIIKFALNSILDKSLRGQATKFYYIVAVVPGFSETAMKLCDEWNSEQFVEDELKEWSTNVVKKYEGLKTLSWETHSSELKDFICSVKIEFFPQEELTLRLNEFPNLIDMFFAVDTVVNIEVFEKLLESRDRQAFKSEVSLTKVEHDLKKKNPELFESLQEIKKRYRAEVEDRQPDFSKLTNYKRDHSCELRRIVDILYEKITPPLSDHELYVLAVSAVLHDVAALSPQEDIDKIMDETEAIKYQRRYAQRGSLAFFASEHARLGGRLLKDHGVEKFSIKVEYLTPIALIASARSVEEMVESVGYKTSCFTKGSGHPIRVYLLAILIRIAELLDFQNICSSVLMQGQELLPDFSRSCNIWNDLEQPLLQVNFPTDTDPRLEGTCDDQNIFLGIRRRIQSVSDEIRLARKQLSKRSIPVNCLDLTDLHDDIQSKFTSASSGFRLDENRVLETLIGDALYDTPLAGIRELLQNAVDACQQRKILDENYKPKIRVTLCNGILSVNDNGIGMDTFVIDNFFSRLASTSHQTEDINGFEAIGRFGIGVFSYFLLCDSFEVNTRPLHGEPTRFNAYRVLSCPFFYFDEGHLEESGTTITMFTRQDRENLLTQESVETYISKTFRYVSIPIEVLINEHSFVIEPHIPSISYEEHFKPSFKIEHTPHAENMHLLSARIDSKLLTGEIGITILNQFSNVYPAPLGSLFKPNELGVAIWELGIYVGKVTSKLIPTLVGEVNLKRKIDLRISRDGFVNESTVEEIIHFCELAIMERYVDQFDEYKDAQTNKIEDRKKKGFALPMQTASKKELKYNATEKLYISYFLIHAVIQAANLNNNIWCTLKNRIYVAGFKKVSTSLFPMRWPDIVEESKCVLIISSKVARGGILDETKKQLLIERYKCTLLLGDLHGRDSFLIRSSVLNNFTISAVTTEDASHIMLRPRDSDIESLLPSVNLGQNHFVLFDKDIFFTASFSLHGLFFNKNHVISRAYFEYVVENGRADVSKLFSEFFRLMSEMTMHPFLINEPKSYQFKYISLINTNRCLSQINNLCGCELSLTINDFPEWLRSTVG
jgi:molecular chaperone HtpG